MLRVNFGRSIRLTPNHFYTPESEQKVLEILSRHPGQRIRCVGPQRSWSKVIEADEVLLDLRLLDQVVLDNEFASSSVVVGAGCGLASFLARSMAMLYGARPHWGKLCPLSPAELRRLYPELGTFQEVCQRLDPEQAIPEGEWLSREMAEHLTMLSTFTDPRARFEYLLDQEQHANSSIAQNVFYELMSTSEDTLNRIASTIPKQRVISGVPIFGTTSSAF